MTSTATVRTDPPPLRLVARRGGKPCVACGIISSEPLRKMGLYKGMCGACFTPVPARPLGEQLRLFPAPAQVVFGLRAVLSILLLIGVPRERRRHRRRYVRRRARTEPTWKTVLPPARTAVIAGRKVEVKRRRAQRLRCLPVGEMTFPWRVTPLRKGKSLGTNALTAKDRKESERLHLDLLPELPKTRGDCIGATRPCLHFICRHNLYLDVNPESGSIKYNFPGMEPDELEDLCSLDVADRYAATGSGTTLEHVGLLMGLTLERARQIQDDALADSRLKLDPGREDDTAVDRVDEDESDFDLDDDDTPGAISCPECKRGDPLAIVDVDPPGMTRDEAAAVLQNPTYWKRCIIAGANRPAPTWWWCPRTHWYTVMDKTNPGTVALRVRIDHRGPLRGLPS